MTSKDKASYGSSPPCADINIHLFNCRRGYAYCSFFSLLHNYVRLYVLNTVWNILMLLWSAVCNWRTTVNVSIFMYICTCVYVNLYTLIRVCFCIGCIIFVEWSKSHNSWVCDAVRCRCIQRVCQQHLFVYIFMCVTYKFVNSMCLYINVTAC